MKRENKIRPPRPLQGAMRPILTFDGPADPQKRREHMLRLGGGPAAHASWNMPASSRGSASPFSTRSAMTRSASAVALERASVSVAP
jgi:hypothetical protein